MELVASRSWTRSSLPFSNWRSRRSFRRLSKRAATACGLQSSWASERPRSIESSRNIGWKTRRKFHPRPEDRHRKGLPQNKVYHSTLSVAARRDRIVPLWVLVVGSDVQVFHLLVADFDPGLVPAFV